MNDPHRLLDEGGSSFESKLLQAGQKDAPAPHNRRRIAAALGVGSVFAASTVATGASATGKAWFGLATAGAVRLAAGVTAGALAIYGGAQVLAPEPPAPSVKAPVTVSRPAPAPERKEIVAPAPEAPAPADAAEPAVRRPAQSNPPDTLSEELAVLDQARRALAKHDHNTALSRLDEYTVRFPKRRLSSEATVLRIETLVKSGDTAQAARLGRDFLGRQPNGPYAKRVSSLIGDTRAAPAPGK
jgi:hypothetical protein